MKKAGHKCPAFLGISGGTWLQQMQIMNASVEAKKVWILTVQPRNIIMNKVHVGGEK